MEHFSYILVICFCFVYLRINLSDAAERQCAAREICGQSVVCVCNETYCDDFTTEPPAPGGYVVYTSSKAGKRFSVSYGVLEDDSSARCCHTSLTINPDVKYQTIEGFGGAVTDAASMNWKNLSQILQSSLINSYFSDHGIEFNMLRVPIGGTDFSTHPYAYNEYPVNDTKLSNYSLPMEDTEFKIPMIRAITSASPAMVHVVATTWSPPPWMKTNNAFAGKSRLRKEFYQTYADYHLKFVHLYANNGVPVWAITTTNEPFNGIIPLNDFNSLGWTPNQMGNWIVNNLGPTIRNSSFNKLKILTMDDQRFMIPIWFDVMVAEHPKVLDYIDGVAVHYYADFLTPSSLLSGIPKKFPGKFVIATEASQGSFPWQTKLVLGSWKRASDYVVDIMKDLNSDVVGWLDWNLCLNDEGGPNWVKNFVDSPIIVYSDKGEFIKQPMFYALGHFSKFIPRGSRRIQVKESRWSSIKRMFFLKSIRHVAFLTSKGTVVIVLYNSGRGTTVAVKLGGQKASLKLDANSITTVEFEYVPIVNNETFKSK